MCAHEPANKYHEPPAAPPTAGPASPFSPTSPHPGGWTGRSGSATGQVPNRQRGMLLLLLPRMLLVYELSRTP